MAVNPEQKRLHSDLNAIGLRAQATAAGLVQLCRELQSAGVLQDDALNRIKAAIADEIAFDAPRTATVENYRRQIGRRLDTIFAGRAKVGSADHLADPSSEGAAPEG